MARIKRPPTDSEESEEDDVTAKKKARGGGKDDSDPEYSDSSVKNTKKTGRYVMTCLFTQESHNS